MLTFAAAAVSLTLLPFASASSSATPTTTKTTTKTVVCRVPGTVTIDSAGVPQMDLRVTSTNADIAANGNESRLSGGNGGCEDPSHIRLADATFSNTSLLEGGGGWDNVTVVGEARLLQTSDFGNLQVWYAAGVAEGFATFEAISNILPFRNYSYSPKAASWIDSHVSFVQNMTLTNFTPFWKQVRRHMVQMAGIAEGYNRKQQQLRLSASSSSSSQEFQPLTFTDVFRMNIAGEYKDIQAAVNETENTSVGNEAMPQQGSALITVASTTASTRKKSAITPTANVNDEPPREDVLLVGHTTIRDYQYLMRRQYKAYTLSIDADGALTTVAMTADPLMITSSDDWLQTKPHKLAVLSTLNSLYNTSLYTHIAAPNACVSQFLRAAAASHLSRSGPEWVSYFSASYAAGTRSAQWMVVDFKQFNNADDGGKGKVTNDTLWVVEEAPAMFIAADMSQNLVKQQQEEGDDSTAGGYWASVNRPFFPEMFSWMGYSAMVEAHGPFYSYESSPRAEAFAALHGTVDSVEAMAQLMRYNDYGGGGKGSGPFSIIQQCEGCDPTDSPYNAVAPRNDLVLANASFGNLDPTTRSFFERAAFGAIDCKVTSSDSVKSLSTYAVLGPTTGLTVASTGTSNSLSPLYHHQTSAVVTLPPFSWCSQFPDSPYATADGMFKGVFNFSFESIGPQPSAFRYDGTPFASRSASPTTVTYVYRVSGDASINTTTGVPSMGFVVSTVFEGDDAPLCTFNVTAPNAVTFLPSSSSSTKAMPIKNYKDENSHRCPLAATAILNFTSPRIGYDVVTVGGASKHQLSTREGAMEAWLAAGIAEGYGTFQTLSDVIAAEGPTIDPDDAQWVADHIAFMRKNAVAAAVNASDDNDDSNIVPPSPKSNLSTTENIAFWRQVHKQLLQMEGVVLGYNAFCEEIGNAAAKVTFEEIFALNFMPEIGYIPTANTRAKNGQITTTATPPSHNFRALTKASSSDRKALREARGPIITAEDMHCSALIRMTDEDCFFSHVGWSGYHVLVGRQYKTYVFETTISMSGNAGCISSGDDWYQTSKHLAVMETTIGFYNTSLDQFIVPQCASEFMRVMAATYLSAAGEQWVRYFANHPSGTYCNQWMVLDYKLYTQGMSPADVANGTLWVAEEIPSLVSFADMSSYLRRDGYWASYNVPLFPDVVAISGYQSMADAHGSFWTYEGTNRALIFARNATEYVKDLPSMQRTMRYNDYQNDPLQRFQGCEGCMPAYSPMLGIAERADLADPNATYGSMGEAYGRQFFSGGAFGAIGAKITSKAMLMGYKSTDDDNHDEEEHPQEKDFTAQRLEAAGIEGKHHHERRSLTASMAFGPTHDQVPVFRWATYNGEGKERGALSGMPQVFEYEFATVAPAFVELPSGADHNDEDDDGKKLNAWGVALVAVGAAATVFGAVGLLIFYRVRSRGIATAGNEEKLLESDEKQQRALNN